MSAATSKTKQPGQGRSLLTGILIGLVAGVGVSAGVAVWVARMPSPFQNRALEVGAPAAEAQRAPASAPQPAAGGVADDKAPAPAVSVNAPGAAPAAGAAVAPPTGGPAAEPGASGGTPTAVGTARDSGSTSAALAVTKSMSTGTTTWLQVGAYGSEDDAQKQVESVAVATGVRASVQAIQQSEKTLYRVRLGPYIQKADYAELSDALKSNGISATIIHTTGQ